MPSLPSVLIEREDFEERIHAYNPFNPSNNLDWQDHAACAGCEACTNIFSDLD